MCHLLKYDHDIIRNELLLKDSYVDVNKQPPVNTYPENATYDKVFAICNISVSVDPRQ